MADTSAPLHRSLLHVCTGILGIMVVASLALARVVLLPLALAILLAFILTPIMVRLQRRGVGRLPAVMLVSALSLAVIGGLGTVIVMQLRSLADNLPDYRKNIAQKAAAFREAGPGNVVENIQIALSDIHDEIAGPAQNDPPLPVEIHQTGVARFEAIAGPMLSVLANVALVAILVLFMLATHEDLRDRLIRIAGHGRLTDTARALEDASRRVSRFLQMQLAINVFFGLALGLALFAIGVPQAFLWGLIVGALRFVPYLGSLAGALMLAMLSVGIFPGWAEPLEVFGIFVVLEIVTANVLEPLLIGRSTGVSPLALLIAAAFWTWLWGPAGLLLSTPLTVCLVVVGRYVPGLEFFGVLLGDEPALSPGQRYYQRLLAHDPDEAIDLVEEHLKTNPRDPFYDEVLLAALVLARGDADKGTLPPGDLQGLLQDMRQILEEIVLVRCPTPAGNGTAERRGPLVLGIPADGEADELALVMLKQLLDGEGCRFEVLPAGMTAAEAVARVAEDSPAGVCIAALPPVGLAKARYLCKRLRAEFPDLEIVVGRWGQKQDDQARARCLAAGAGAFGSTLLESRVQVQPLLHENGLPSRRPEPAAALANERN